MLSKYSSIWAVSSVPSTMVKLFADNADMLNSEDTAYVYTAAGEALAQYEATQEDIDNAAAGILNAAGGESQPTAEIASAETTAEAPALRPQELRALQSLLQSLYSQALALRSARSSNS